MSNESKKKLALKPTLIIILLLFSGWFLFREQQKELPYRVVGSELLEIKEQCKELAEATETRWNESNIGTHLLVGHGYSEFGGYCYAEIIQNFVGDDGKVLFNTTQGKEEFVRAWPKDASWYQKDFDWFVLGKKRIIDFRGPWLVY